MPVYQERLIRLEAYQWNGEIPFKPTEGFEPEIWPKELGFKGYYELVSTRSDRRTSYQLTSGCYIIKHPLGHYESMNKDRFELYFEEVRDGTVQREIGTHADPQMDGA